MSTTTTGGFREALDHAVIRAEKKKADSDSCPECSKKAALLTLSFRGIRVGKLCRFCPFTSLVGVVEDKRTKLKLVAKAK